MLYDPSEQADPDPAVLVDTIDIRLFVWRSEYTPLVVMVAYFLSEMTESGDSQRVNSLSGWSMGILPSPRWMRTGIPSFLKAGWTFRLSVRRSDIPFGRCLMDCSSGWG